MAEQRNIAILTYDSASLFELACAVELFALPRPEIENWYKTDVVSFEAGLQHTTGGLLLASKLIDSLDKYDTLIIPSWPVSRTDIDHTLRLKINHFYQHGGRIYSFCSGAFLLAELGLLHNKQATTHWQYADQFQKRFTSVNYIDDVLYLFDQQIGCSAGSAASIDLCLALIRHDHGYQVANQVARRLVVSTHRKGGQSQFVETPLQKTPNHFGQSLDWAIQNLNQEIKIQTLAEKALMSRRTFDRKFRASFNMSPKQWLTNQRLDLSKGLLEQSSSSIEVIATQAGFENATTMRHHFRKTVGISPKRYREQFASPTKH